MASIMRDKSSARGKKLCLKTSAPDLFQVCGCIPFIRSPIIHIIYVTKMEMNYFQYNIIYLFGIEKVQGPYIKDV